MSFDLRKDILEAAESESSRNKIVLSKCNFCTKSTPDGGCYWIIHSLRESDCNKAIERMAECLGGLRIKK